MRGHIRKRGDRRYQVRVSMGFDASGKRRRHEKTIHGTKKSAERYLRDYIQAYETGRVVQPSQQALREYLLHWVEVAKSGKLAERTLHDYRRIITSHSKGKIGDTPLCDLKAMAVQEFYQSLAHYSLSQRRQVHNILKPALRQAVQWGLLEWNPCDRVEPPRGKQRRDKNNVRAMTQMQAQRFLRAAEEDKWAVLWQLLLATGLRPQEAYALQWSEVDWDNDIIRIVHSLYRRRGAGGGWTLQPTKTNRSRRAIVVPRSVMQKLRAHRQHQLEERAIWRKPYTDNGFVFACHNGSPLHERNLDQRHFKPTLERAGLEGFRVYDLRHTCATLLLLRKVQPKIVSERLGHSSITLTLDTYSHVLPTMQKMAARELEATGLF